MRLRSETIEMIETEPSLIGTMMPSERKIASNVFQRNLYFSKSPSRHRAKQQREKDCADGYNNGIHVVGGNGAIAEDLAVTD